MRAGVALLLAGAALAGCSQAPQYRVPVTPSAAAFKEASGWAAAVPADTVPRGAWWTVFGDPVLDDLEGRGTAGSPTVAAALARYDRVVAIADRAGAELRPTVTLGSDLSRERASRGRPLSRGTGGTYTDRTLLGAFDWEVDLWGRLRDTARAGRADAVASDADLAATRLSLQASIADTYVRLRGLDAQIGLLRQTIAAFDRAYTLTEARHEGGIASGLDTSRARSQLSDARAQLAQVVLDRAVLEHRTAVLVGDTPAGFTLPVATRQIDPVPVAAGTPSELLQRRPDIAAAERRVFAANARIGAARAAWFPQLTLGLSGGYESTSGSIVSAASSFWALGPLSLAGAIFDGGRRNADIRRSRAEFDEAAADYRSTVLDAFGEVEDSLAGARQLAEAEREQQDAARAAERTSELALTRYRDGASDYLEVVVAQTAALVTRRAALALQYQRLQASVALVRATGGGFGGVGTGARRTR